MSTTPKALPVMVGEDELSRARNYVRLYLGESEPITLEYLAAYGRMRFLGMIEPEPGPAPETADIRAAKEFYGLICPGCGGEKVSAYWFCKACWEMVATSKTLRDKLWSRSFEIKILTYYWEAKAKLKGGR